MAKPGPALFELIRSPSALQSGAARRQTTPDGEPPAAPEPPPPPVSELPAAAAPVSVASRQAVGSVAQMPKPRVRLATSASVASEPEAPKAEAAPEPTPRAESGGSTPKFNWRRPMQVTSSGVMLVGAGVLVLILVVWVGAYTLGSKDGQAKTLEDKGLTGPAVVDPLKTPVNPGLVVPEPSQGRQAVVPKGTQPKTSPVSFNGPQADIASGLNYCVAASRLEKGPAEKAAVYLTENGLPSTAVQVVEGQWSGASSSGSWMVVVLKGITKAEYSGRDSVRVEVEQKLSKLGKVAIKDAGRYDFGQFAWCKRK